MKQRFLNYIDNIKKHIKNFDWNTYCKNNKMRLIMTAFGVVVLCFYSVLFINAVSKANIVPQSEKEQSTNETDNEEQTGIDEEKKDSNDIFRSPYTDETIPTDIKDKMNQMVLSPAGTGNTDLDNKVNNIISKVCTEDMSVYEKIKNTYDYLHYYTQITDEQGTDSMGAAFSDMQYESELDLEIVFRANRLLENEYRGDSRDIASLLTVLLRKIGVDAHYVSGHDYDYGYVAISLDNKYYVFDLANEEKSADNTLNRYDKFSKNIDDYPDKYTVYKIESYMALSKNFARLNSFTFDIQISGAGHSYVKSMSYKDSVDENDNTVSESLSWGIEKNHSLVINGSLSDSAEVNTWKLDVYYYDLKNQFIGSVPVYNEKTERTRNEHILQPAYAGTMRIEYMVLDVNNRQCKYIITISVKDIPAETVTSGGQNPTTVNRVTGNQNNITKPAVNQTTESFTTDNRTEITGNGETEPMTQPVTQPITDSMTEPKTEPMTDPVSQPVTEPITESVTQPITDSMTEPETDPMTEPETEPVTEPETEPVTEPETESVADPPDIDFNMGEVPDWE